MIETINYYPSYFSANSAAQTSCNQTFKRGDSPNTLPAGQKTVILQNIPPDKTEFSASQKLKSNKDKSASTGKKIALGIAGTAATIYGCIVGHRILNKPAFETVQKNFSEIFGRDIPKEEVLKLIKNYKEIVKNNNTNEYHNKLFEQIKKDMGYENLDIKLVIKKLKDGSFKTFNAHNKNGSAGAVNHEITIYPRTANLNIGRSIQRTTFGTMFHEFRHIKQAEIAYRTNPEKLVDAYCDNIIKNHPEFVEHLMKENSSSRSDTLRNLRHELRNDIDALFAKYPKLPQGSAEYKKGLEYIDCERNYTTKGTEYFNQINEKEAFEVGDKARAIYDYIASPWRLF